MFQRFAFFVVIAFLASACAHNEHAAAADNVSKSEGRRRSNGRLRIAPWGSARRLVRRRDERSRKAGRVESRGDGGSAERQARRAPRRNPQFRIDVQSVASGRDLRPQSPGRGRNPRRVGCGGPGGGLVWRARDADNYYIARWNPLEKNLRAYKVEGAKRTMFKSVDVDADVAKWHELGVKMVGPDITVIFDDKPLIKSPTARLRRPERWDCGRRPMRRVASTTSK